MDLDRHVKSARSNSPPPFAHSRAESPTHQRVSFIDNLSQKLAYEWKNIYRSLAQADLNKSGKVTVKEFNNIVNKIGVNLTKEETGKAVRMFSQGDLIDYFSMSNELGLHKPSMNFMKSGSKTLEGLKRLGGQSDTYAEEFIKTKNSPSKGIHTESSKEAIKYTIQQNKASINKMLRDLDKAEKGTLTEQDLVKALRVFGIYMPKKVSMA